MTIKVGESFPVQLYLQSEQPISNLPITIGFDSKALEVVNVSIGDFLGQGGALVSSASQIDPAGEIQLLATRVGEGGASARGRVATIYFKALTDAKFARIEILSVEAFSASGEHVPVPTPPPYIFKAVPK